MSIYEIFVCTLVVLVACINIILLVKKGKKEEWDGEEVLENILEQILRLCTSTLQIVKEQRSEFETEKEFRLRLAEIVAIDVRFLLEETGTPEYLLNVLTKDFIAEFIYNSFNMYEKEIGLIEAEKEYTMKKLAALRSTEPEEEPQLTDISHVFQE